jgi:predicted outer membrane repeat protein
MSHVHVVTSFKIKSQKRNEKLSNNDALDHGGAVAATSIRFSKESPSIPMLDCFYDETAADAFARVSRFLSLLSSESKH